MAEKSIREIIEVKQKGFDAFIESVTARHWEKLPTPAEAKQSEALKRLDDAAQSAPLSRGVMPRTVFGVILPLIVILIAILSLLIPFLIHAAAK